MKILLTGVTGYIGHRLLPELLDKGHEVVCLVRDKNRFNIKGYEHEKLQVVEGDVSKSEYLSQIPQDIEAAYYLIHSMSTTSGDFEQMEAIGAENFRLAMDERKVKQVVYLSGIVNDEDLSKHLQSRKKVEEILGRGRFHLTTLRSGIIVGSGSASFEIIRDLVEKLPIMITPKWLNTRSQPIAIRNVIQYLIGVLDFPKAYDQSFDIAGPEVLTYKDMLLRLAKVRGLKRYIFTLPIMTPKLSSYWLYFVTSTSYSLAVNLVKSMKIEIIGRKNDLGQWLNIELVAYDDAIKQAFDVIEQQRVLSSWTDALSNNELSLRKTELIHVPSHGTLNDRRSRPLNADNTALEKIWAIGGKTGWYAGDWLWNIRGFLDKLVGGVGLRRGRKNPTEISAGESLDFWRVILASKEEKRLLLYAEMKLPGEAWLEFRIEDQELIQTATFRPWGLTGRLYWYAMLPFHEFIFGRMIRRIAE